MFRMVRVVIGHVEMSVEGPALLADVCDDLRAAVHFSCRDGNCGTCVIEVLEGRDKLVPEGELEARTKKVYGVDQHDRLACLVRIANCRGLLRLRAKP